MNLKTKMLLFALPVAVVVAVALLVVFREDREENQSPARSESAAPAVDEGIHLPPVAESASIETSEFSSQPNEKDAAATGAAVPTLSLHQRMKNLASSREGANAGHVTLGAQVMGWDAKVFCEHVEKSKNKDLILSLIVDYYEENVVLGSDYTDRMFAFKKSLDANGRVKTVSNADMQRMYVAPDERLLHFGTYSEKETMWELIAVVKKSEIPALESISDKMEDLRVDTRRKITDLIR